GRQAVLLGRREAGRRRQVVRELVSGPVPQGGQRRRRVQGPGPSQVVPAKRLRPLRHERQCLGVVSGLLRPGLLRAVAEGQPGGAGTGRNVPKAASRGAPAGAGRSCATTSTAGGTCRAPATRTPPTAAPTTPASAASRTRSNPVLRSWG